MTGMRILVCNDDGIDAPGIAALWRELRALGHVDVVAPDTHQSATGHAITLYQPVAAREVQLEPDLVGYAVSGTPADCVKLAMRVLLDRPADLVVSGINAGSNVGCNVLYSGTVSAAAEGVLCGAAGVAVSLTRCDRPDFDTAARIAREVIAQLLEMDIPQHTLFNINIPTLAAGWPKGVRWAAQAMDPMIDQYDRVDGDERWRTYQLAGASDTAFAADTANGHDLQAIRDGYVAVTPLHLDLTHRPTLAALAKRSIRISDPAD